MTIKDNYKDINDSFETGFENQSNKELVHRHKVAYPMRIGFDDKFSETYSKIERENIALEMNRRLIDEIGEFDKSSAEQTKKMINLTKWIMWLTIALGVLALIQIIILLVPLFSV